MIKILTLGTKYEYPKYKYRAASDFFFSLIILIVLILGVVASLQMSKLRESEQDVETNWMASIRQTGLINAKALHLRIESNRLVQKKDPQRRIAALDDIGAYRSELVRAVSDYAPLISSDEEKALYLSVKSSAETYLKQLDIFELEVRSGNDAASELTVSDVLPKYAIDLEAKIIKLAHYNDTGAAAAGVESSGAYLNGIKLVIVLILIVIVLTIVLALVLIRSVTLPISDALKVAERIASGDLSEDVLQNGSDEVGRLLYALSKMQDNLHETVSKISDSATQLASASEEMSAVTEEASRVLTQQNDEVSQAATAINEMSAAVDDVARNANAASTTSRDTMEFAHSGIEKVAETLKVIESLAANVTGTGGKVKELSARAQNISKVVEVIRAIAEQTNLLALNAAIEAARAGEQGRGFAVVADEVRALAHRTQQSTLEIEQMITTIQEDSLQAVDAINESSIMSTDAITVAQSADVSLKQIADAVDQINQRNHQIAVASEEQANVAKEADRNLTSIKDLSIQSATGAEQTASACAELANLAIELNELIVKFKI